MNKLRAATGMRQPACGRQGEGEDCFVSRVLGILAMTLAIDKQPGPGTQDREPLFYNNFPCGKIFINQQINDIEPPGLPAQINLIQEVFCCFIQI